VDHVCPSWGGFGRLKRKGYRKGNEECTWYVDQRIFVGNVDEIERGRAEEDVKGCSSSNIERQDATKTNVSSALVRSVAGTAGVTTVCALCAGEG